MSKGSGLLRNKLLNFNNSGGTLVLSPSVTLGNLALDAQSTILLAQNDHVIQPTTSSLLAKSLSFKDL
jgi:hypothetical protein